MKKKLISALLCTALISTLAAGCSTQASQKSKGESGKEITKEVSEMTDDEKEDAWKKEPAYGTTITVGYNGGACLGGFGIALANGFYEKEGLEVEIVNMTSATDALGTGQVDVAGDHIATLLVPTVNGVNMTFTTASQTGCKSLYVLADSDIQTTSDLIGKTIAVPDGIGMSDQNITMRYLSKDGIDPQKDVNYKVVTNDAIVQALQTGEVQAGNLSDQFAAPFVEDGTLRYIRSITWDEDFAHEPCCVHAINSDFLEQNPITSEKLTRAFREACLWIEDNKEEATDILLENKWASGDRALVLKMMESWNFGITDQECEDALKNVLDDYKSFGLIEFDDTQETLDKVWAPLLQNK